MRFNFFGDSWYWTWNWNSPRSAHGVKSKQVKKLYSSPYEDADRDSIPFLKILLEHLGHECNRAHCWPARSFTDTVDAIVNNEFKGDADDVNVIFYSMDLRGPDMAKFLNQRPGMFVTELLEDLHDITVANLERLGKYAKATKQKFILAGGQGTLLPEVFNRASHCRNLHLLVYCIVLTQVTTMEPANRPIFKLADITGNGTDTSNPVQWEKLHPSVVERVHKDMELWDKHSGDMTWPDAAHMSPSGVVFFIDRLFSYLENTDSTI